MKVYTYKDFELAREHSRDADRHLGRMQSHFDRADVAQMYLERAREDAKRAAQQLGFTVTERSQSE